MIPAMNKMKMILSRLVSEKWVNQNAKDDQLVMFLFHLFYICPMCESTLKLGFQQLLFVIKDIIFSWIHIWTYVRPFNWTRVVESGERHMAHLNIVIQYFEGYWNNPWHNIYYNKQLWVHKRSKNGYIYHDTM